MHLTGLCTKMAETSGFSSSSINMHKGITITALQLQISQTDACLVNLQNVVLFNATAGNAWTDAGFDNEGAVDFWWTHALISDDVRDSLLQSCNFSGVGPLRQSPLEGANLERNGKLEVGHPRLAACCLNQPVCNVWLRLCQTRQVSFWHISASATWYLHCIA